MSGPLDSHCSICLARYNAIARPSVRLSVCPSVCLSIRRVDHKRTVEVRIVKFSPYMVGQIKWHHFTFLLVTN